MNLLYAPFRFRYMRRKELASQTRGIAFAEEVAYEMNIKHISQITKLPISEPQPIVLETITVVEEVKQVENQATAEVNGAGYEVDLSASKGKDKVEVISEVDLDKGGVAAM